MLKINLFTVGYPAPEWDPFLQHYIKQLSPFCQFKLTNLTPIKNPGKTINSANLKRQETTRLLEAISRLPPTNTLILPLDEHGEAWTSEELAQQLSLWQNTRDHLYLMIGGAEGLDLELLRKHNLVKYWSLSKLTLPHQFVKLLVTEQLYRAWSILRHHPYHRH